MEVEEKEFEEEGIIFPGRCQDWLGLSLVEEPNKTAVGGKKGKGLRWRILRGGGGGGGGLSN